MTSNGLMATMQCYFIKFGSFAASYITLVESQTHTVCAQKSGTQNLVCGRRPLHFLWWYCERLQRKSAVKWKIQIVQDWVAISAIAEFLLYWLNRTANTAGKIMEPGVQSWSRSPRSLDSSPGPESES